MRARAGDDVRTGSQVMPLAAQIIDQQVSGIAARQEDAFTHELRFGDDAGKRRSAAFLFLAAKTMFELSDDETLEGIVDGGDDYGIVALYFETPDQGEIVTARPLVSGWCRVDSGRACREEEAAGCGGRLTP